MNRQLRRPIAALAGVALLLPAFAACGGEDDSAGGSDEEYVKSVCEALARFDERRVELTGTATAAVEEDVAEDFAELIRDLGNDMDDANPPADAEEAHNAVVDALGEAADTVDEGGITALFNVELPAVQLAPEVRNRLQAVFNTTPECAGADSIFS